MLSHTRQHILTVEAGDGPQQIDILATYVGNISKAILLWGGPEASGDCGQR